MESAHRQSLDEGRPHPGRDDEQAIRLVPLGGELGQELVRRDAHRGRQPRLGAHAPPDVRGDGGRWPEEPLRAADVEEGLVDGERLHERRHLGEDRENAVEGSR